MCKGATKMKKTYYVNVNQLIDNDATIIDEETLKAAEQGKNYLNPDDFILHGEFENMEEARQKLWDENWDSYFCEMFDL